MYVMNYYFNFDSNLDKPSPRPPSVPHNPWPLALSCPKASGSSYLPGHQVFVAEKSQFWISLVFLFALLDPR